MVAIPIIRCYSDLVKIDSYEERFNYLYLGDCKIGEETFGFDRYLNQLFYKDKEWLKVRDDVIIRDMGCDLGIEGFDIYGIITVHHMNPIDKDDILNRTEFLLNPEFLICTASNTHKLLHFGDGALPQIKPIERSKNDTCPWRK